MRLTHLSFRKNDTLASGVSENPVCEMYWGVSVPVVMRVPCPSLRYSPFSPNVPLTAFDW